MAANKDPICSGVTTPCRLDSTLLFVRVRAVAGPMFNPVMPPVMGRWSPGSSPDLQKKVWPSRRSSRRRKNVVLQETSEVDRENPQDRQVGERTKHRTMQERELKQAEKKHAP